MANGINTTRGQKTKKEEVTGSGSKELTQSILPDDTLVKLMALNGSELRVVFDSAIKDYNVRMINENDQFTDQMEEYTNQIENNETKAADLYRQIEILEKENERIIIAKNEETERHEGVLYKLDEGRTTIENLMQLFKPKLDGFTD